jgi:hypothetical protein
MLIKLKQSFLGSTAGKVMDVPDDEAKTLCEKGLADPAGDDALAPIITRAAEEGEVTVYVYCSARMSNGLW